MCLIEFISLRDSVLPDLAVVQLSRVGVMTISSIDSVLLDLAAVQLSLEEFTLI